MKKFFLQHKWQFVCAIFLSIIVVPAIINVLFKLESPWSFFDAEWEAGDVLSFYGAMLASVTTIFGVYISIEYAQRNYRLDEANRVKPYFAFTQYKTESTVNLTLQESTDNENKKNQHSENIYREYKQEEVYLLINENRINFYEELPKQQQLLLKNCGIEWCNCGNRAIIQPHNFISLPFDVENVGNGASINTMIAFYKEGEARRGLNVYTIKQGRSFYFHIFVDGIDASIMSDKYVVELVYSDIIGNYYSQKYSAELGKNGAGDPMISISLDGKQESVLIDKEKEAHNG